MALNSGFLSLVSKRKRAACQILLQNADEVFIVRVTSNLTCAPAKSTHMNDNAVCEGFKITFLSNKALPRALTSKIGSSRKEAGVFIMVVLGGIYQEHKIADI